MSVSMSDIKKLREETGAGVMDAKKALEESSGDMKKARDWIEKKGMQRAEKKSDRETVAGAVFSYIHHNNNLGAIVSLGCETDFVAKTDEFMNLGREVAMQVASTNPETVEELMAQEYIRDSSKTIERLIKETAGKIGENIKINSFSRATI